ncbi:MAG: LysM peptidoglycan-binding domain-containing protein [Caulobacterales bacterium]|uniref:LysM peptidoglycan-binding domain-containing protein n=1 Tax=Glycocaulis sp. TaxID=1969725 RepID=UPI003FA06A2A
MAATRSFIIAAVLLVVAVGAAALYIATRPSADPELQAVPEVSEQASEEAPRPAATSLTPPSFDVVRVDARGNAVIAGRGAPGASVGLLANGDELTRTTITPAGEWVIILQTPLPAGTVELSLMMRTPDGQEVRSDQVVVVSVPASRDETPLVVLGRPGEASRVLQGPQDGVGTGPLVLETVDYDENGSVIFSGRAEPGAGVRILANGDVVAETEADEAGRWSVAANTGFAPGVYDLQIDQLDADGRVTAVIALPFERATREALAMGGERVVVQPGNSLWRIARRLYGDGFQYTIIYQANREQIRDPDLIYPGQILAAPGEE